MGTTALFAELVVGGVMTLTWMFLLAVTVLGPSRFAPLLEIPPPVAAGLLLALAYAMGVVFDRVWDSLLDVTGLQLWFRGGPQMATPVSDWERKRRRVFGADSTTAVEFVNYHRSRMRVARASLFNFTLITASGLAYLMVRYGGVGTAEFALAAVTGGLLCAASALALRNLGRSHDRVLEIVSVEEAVMPRPQNDYDGSRVGTESSADEAVREKVE
jgi:hypothetical protein